MDLRDTVLHKSDDDLLAMVYQLDQWNPEMLIAVENELVKRNLLPVDLLEQKQQLITAEEQVLSKGRQASLAGLVIGWITVFGLLGAAIGYNYSFAKARSKYANKVYFKYNEESRRKGQILYYCSLLLSGILLIYRLIVRTGTSF